MSDHTQLLLTKIVATIGPACSKVQTLVRMIEEGARVIRINFSHGDFAQFTQSLQAVRQASNQTQIPVGVLGDLRGPKLRIGKVKDDKLQLETGQCVHFVSQAIEGFKDSTSGQITLSTTYPPIVDEADPGHRLLLDDGAIHLLITQRQSKDGKNYLVCQVTRGGTLSSNKGVNLPDTHISASSLTDYDKRCIQWAIEHNLDFLALSFVRNHQDILQLQSLLDKRGEHLPIPIIAKIETPQAVRDIEKICQCADGLMVARGDLGVELDIAKVPVVQKQIIKTARTYGKPVIVATQMLQSMINQPSPTRAEVSDIANAIMDKTDALMLSGETAIGQYPLQTVQAMAHTARTTEQYLAANRNRLSQPPSHLQKSKYHTAALAHGVSAAASDMGCQCVVMWSQRGGGARYLSQNRLTVPIVAVSSNETALRRMGFLFGVRPVLMAPPSDIDRFIGQTDQFLVDKHWAKQGDPLVVMCGWPLGTPGVTNQIIVHYVDGVCRLE